MSKAIMHGRTRPEIRRLSSGTVLTRQGEEATELYLLDGVLALSVNGDSWLN
jgi:hypothetical protein